MLLLIASLPSCSGFQAEPVSVELRCPAVPYDLVAEAKRKPTIKGRANIEVAGWLISDVKRKNSALVRSIKLYNACRKA